MWWHSQCSWLTVWTMTSFLPTSLLITPIPQRLRCQMHFYQWTCAALGIFYVLNDTNVALMLLFLTSRIILHKSNCPLLTYVLGSVTVFRSSSSLSYQEYFGSTVSSSSSTTSVATGRSDHFTSMP